MADLLRRIDRSRWLPQLKDAPRPSTAFKDMHPQDRSLSFWRLPEANPERDVFIENVAIELSLSRDKLDHFEYALVSEEKVHALAIVTRDAPVTAFDPSLNQAHVELEDPGVFLMAQLVLAMNPGFRIVRPTVIKLVRNAVAAGRIPQQRLGEKIRDTLAKHP